MRCEEKERETPSTAKRGNTVNYTVCVCVCLNIINRADRIMKISLEPLSCFVLLTRLKN